MSEIAKILSRNDTGETGGHQAGILIPKRREVLSHFPTLDTAVHNPRCRVIFKDSSGTKWSFEFIYYNGKFHGGTRNEYRLTHMTEYIRSNGLRSGDSIVFTNTPGEPRRISYRRASDPSPAGAGVLRLNASWRLIQF